MLLAYALQISVDRAERGMNPIEKSSGKPGERINRAVILWHTERQLRFMSIFVGSTKLNVYEESKKDSFRWKAKLCHDTPRGYKDFRLCWGLQRLSSI